VLPRKHATDSDVADIRRLFYVALTRARKHVTVITPLEESDGKVLSPLRFINELDEKHIAKTEIPKVEVQVDVHSGAGNSESSASSTASTTRSKLTEFAKRVLLEKGLSPTALNHFLTCPNQFLYQSILKLPQAPATSAEKGNAMHSAIAAVWTSEQRSISAIEDVLRTKITEYFNESLLSIADKDAVKKELFDALPDVAREMMAHTAIKNIAQTVLPEHWVQTNFAGSYEGKTIDIPIHGKLDAIVDDGSSVLVFDYKTKQAMSLNEIKGLTKNSDGGYFRQLIFYKILVSSDSRWKTRQVTPALVFVSPDSKGRCPTVSLPIEQADIDGLKNNIQSLIDSVWSNKIATAVCDDSKCEWCGLAKLLCD
jgi:DNA helicase-2/ATP-dependent DNA helicase PcrA